MTRLELLKKELEIAKSLECLSFEGKQIAIEWYQHEIECIEKYGSPNPDYKDETK